ncbi:RHS repeat domain-containing protein [Flavobacterium ardleyense]|uniref:RHS repeat domain-containing protein n=1 Tax=Flavobacterium ardleyense TaxID=2038737 RepID=A0ABW5Z9M2_9FLAO
MRGEKKFNILADHLGTPTHLFSEQGDNIWEGSLDSYGKLRIDKGEIGSCPFRYQGQYEDVETEVGGSRIPKKNNNNLVSKLDFIITVLGIMMLRKDAIFLKIQLG